MRKRFLLLCFIAISIVLLIRCGNDEEKSPYKAINNPEAHYVGMETCKTCHAGIYESFIQTGMGQSWGLANKLKSSADFSNAKALVYDSIKNLYYKPYWDGDSLCILEYRLTGKDTTHKRIEKVSYIVGSGQHTNSHIININGYLHQAPITFYTQKGKWDLAPGFEKGMNSRFDRKIELECITCHNGYPEFVAESFNKFNSIKLGIDCERCHGPGSLHVAAKQNGDIVDTAKLIDYTIVNPRKLSIDVQNNLCQRCHLQGIAVLQDGKSFMDFLPSQELKKSMHVFMPSYSGDENHMIMASHVERMKMSDCYVNSNKMSCITCHNPHVSVKFTAQEVFINACKNCHTSINDCKENISVRETKKDNCITCHMPKNGSIDIPHVAVTDHYIRRKAKVENKEAIAKFLGLVCYNDDKVDARTQAQAYLEFYERYEPNKFFLDSAFTLLIKAGADTSDGFDADVIRAFFLREDYNKIVILSKKVKPNEIKNAWTNYRIGEAYLKQGQFARSIEFLQVAVTIKKYALDFQHKLATAYVENNQFIEAKKVFEFILNENPKYTAAYGSLGYLAMQAGDMHKAKYYLQQSILLDPDQLQVLINLAVVYHQSNQGNLIKPLLYHALQLDSENVQVKAMLRDME